MKNFNPKIPQLVSYPRTGSHWVRMILEQYLNKFCLPTSFYGEKDYWGYHLHDRIVGKGDEGITSGFDKVIYLYRNPIDTIFSQLKYENMNIDSDFDVNSISNEYLNHLNRWLYNTEDCQNIIYIKYEDIKSNHNSEFKKILDFLSYNYDEDKLNKIFESTTLESAKKRISDPQVINSGHFDGEYKKSKEYFEFKYSKLINEKFKSVWK